MATIEDFVVLKEINYGCMTSSQNRFVLPDSPIAMNLSKCEKALCFLCKGKKAPYGSFYEDEWFLDSSASTHFTSFEYDFFNMILSDYGQVETANSKVLLSMVASGTVLIEHEIFDLEKETTKVAVLKLWPVYCVSGMQICLLSIEQILQSGLRVGGDKSGSTFCDNSSDAVISATSNL